MYFPSCKIISIIDNSFYLAIILKPDRRIGQCWEAIVTILREFMLKRNEARSLACEIFITDADIMLDEEKELLNIIIHNMANPLHNRYVKKLCQILNESEVIFPETNLWLVYSSVSNQFHED